MWPNPQFPVLTLCPKLCPKFRWEKVINCHGILTKEFCFFYLRNRSWWFAGSSHVVHIKVQHSITSSLAISPICGYILYLEYLSKLSHNSVALADKFYAAYLYSVLACFAWLILSVCQFQRVSMYSAA